MSTGGISITHRTGGEVFSLTYEVLAGLLDEEFKDFPNPYFGRCELKELQLRLAARLRKEIYGTSGP